jgi:outer membrane receptor protein involved in Fe transport
MKQTSYLAMAIASTITVAGQAHAQAVVGTPSAATPPDVSPTGGNVTPAATASSGLQEIVVTAQKRRQSVNDVGLSITTLDGAAIARRGISDAYDLVKVVPGLSVANAGNGATVVYTLRGVGFNASFLSATSAVAVYQDEVALPYPAMTRSVGLDLERVEVLKGPQGTLFGQNSTAGAINYIAAKPTDKFEGNASASYGSFNWWDIKLAAGGPVTDTLKVRFAVSHDGGDGWQKAYTRDDKLGRRDNTKARAIVLWNPIPDLRVNLTLNYWHDQSDTQALQLVRYEPLQPPGVPAVAAFPTAPHNDRAAEWDPARDPKFNTTLFQPSLRLDYDLTSKITLTSISAYSAYRTNSFLADDGTIFDVGGINQRGKIHDFNQEVRLSGRSKAFNWVIGGNLQRNKIGENLNIDTNFLSNTQNIGGTGISGVCPNHGTDCDPVFSRSKTRANAVFANGEFKASDQISVVAGVRYTKTSIDYRGCNQAGPTIISSSVPGGISSLRNFFNILYGELTGNAGANPIPNSPDACVTLDGISRNGAPPTFLPTDSPQKLTEDNLSWNVTANFKPNPRTLLYARVAQGYKSGSFPTVGATSSVQYLPTKQEGLLAYEAGFKLTLLDRRVQLDGAAFYYDYKNKQLSNFVPDAVFGPLVAIVNVPKSRVAGGEIALTVAPIDGLTLNGAVTYSDSKIQRFVGFDERGVIKDFAGSPFNLSPKWSAVADANYRFAVGSSLTAYFGASTTYHSATTGIIGSGDSAYNIRSYTIFDVQAGIESAAGWSLQVWGKNITNKYYWTNVNHVSDTIVRTAGLPAMYGVTLGYKF